MESTKKKKGAKFSIRHLFFNPKPNSNHETTTMKNVYIRLLFYIDGINNRFVSINGLCLAVVPAEIIKFR